MKSNAVLFVSFCGILFLILIGGCKSSGELTATKELTKVTQKTFNKKWNTPFENYEWFSAKVKMRYSDNTQSQSFHANIRYRKDSVVWMSFTGFLGIEGGRVLITQDSVKIIDRLNKKYYQYSINFIQKYIPFPLNIDDIQAILTGDRFYKHKNKPVIKLDDPFYHVFAGDRYIEGNYWLHPKNYTMAEMRLKDKVEQRQLFYKFDSYKDLEKRPFAYSRQLEFTNGEQRVSLKMDFTKIKTNEPQNFPFTVSDSYQKVN